MHNVCLVLFAEQCRRIDRKMVNVKLGEELGGNQTLRGERNVLLKLREIQTPPLFLKETAKIFTKRVLDTLWKSFIPPTSDSPNREFDVYRIDRS